ncbi:MULTISPECIES: FAD-binding oxidoreductase [unclassified Agrobacterium]|uniref:NAD(P)/FAD-dependent oxidoreductase n=1 Tax=unclassified Agrobacterium TaxID=2632611 RepID=UPI00244C5CCB|nr:MULTISPECIES: FAD-binding oxidoreductase [unclassified Agrobacterium]MDH0616552.1 FAD-binding oxidoreductase [Agrobacterium sp. GD03872]MDH0699146.1 FAD-binding oxidoreductase [Agrobacterium sp. GD03871]MDH1061870.1 FAD-binding oxidoreductase [Agrobacterium sp. GD03992]MDH2213418.1 FAD-binding oxidoreductase [Agrobacterium sp. GD03643]MDH2222162.1 FAD-binding oxidoreductase [Agrobacterium sp. GD03638]
MPANDVIVIGAGVVGLSAAIAAQGRGLSVTVIDREGPAAGASAGNAGAFAFTDILPLASPGILWKAPKWLLDPLGPLSVPPAYALKIAPWMFRFWRACASSKVEHSTAAQTALMDFARAELEPFLKKTDTTAMLRKEGNLQVYESEAEFEASLAGWKARERHGIEFRHLNAEQMAEIQPGIAPRFTCGTFTPGWYSIADPKFYTLALAEHFRTIGGRIECLDIASLRPLEDGVEVVSQDGRTRKASKVVLAAGAFSHRIARSLGEKIPLETERGYNTTLPSGAFDLRTQVTFGGHGFVVTRLSSGIRVGGAVELGGLELPPNFARSEALLAKAKAFLPGLKTEGGKQWMGFRPSLPDSLPAIGQARHTARVVYAFGHGHLGLTQSAGTARIVADLLTGQKPAIDTRAFSPQRF